MMQPLNCCAPGSYARRIQSQDAASSEDEQEWQCFKKVARPEVNAVVEIANISAGHDSCPCQHQPVCAFSSPGQERQCQKCQCQIKRPAEEVDLENGQQLVQVDETGGHRVLPVEANSLPKAPVVTGEKEAARRRLRVASQNGIEAEVKTEKDDCDRDKAQSRYDPALPIMT